MSSDGEDTEENEAWIQWFTRSPGNEFYCEVRETPDALTVGRTSRLDSRSPIPIPFLPQVDRSYIEDGFNLYGLRNMVPNFQACLDVILDRLGELLPFFLPPLPLPLTASFKFRDACVGTQRLWCSSHARTLGPAWPGRQLPSDSLLPSKLRQTCCLAGAAPRRADSDFAQEESEGLAAGAMQLYGLIHARYIVTAHGLR